MSRRPPPAENVVRPATICAFAMIANQVAGKATRDALFLTSFDIDLLPRMVVAAAVVTIAGVIAASRLLPRFGPRLLVPAAFVASAAVQLGIRSLMEHFPRAAAVLLYFHISVFGAVLISWFWSMITERFDPHTARLRIGQIAGGGTVGGLLGGIAAERAATALPISSVLLLLAVLHVVCAAAAAVVGRGAKDPAGGSTRKDASRSAWSVLRRAPYLRNLGFLILCATAAATLLDFVFKLRAQHAFTDGPTLLRFFAAYYTGVALVTALLQSLLTRRVLESAGLARSASVLPGFLGLGGLGCLLTAGLPVLAAARGLESAIRSSLFRSSYELFYTPLPAAEKRATKTVVDVGFDRLGDAVGAGLVQLVIAVGIAGADRILLAGTAALGVAGVILTRRLHAGYVTALERNLVRHSDETRSGPESTEQTAFLEAVTPAGVADSAPDLETGLFTVALDARALWESQRKPGPEREPAAQPAPPDDPLLAAVAALRSRDPSRVRPALRPRDGLAPELVAHAIPLLAWDAVASEAQSALRAVCDRHVGQIVDALLDPEQEFTIRRRLPQVLARGSSERAVQGLVAGLADRRFEVRFQCGAALARVLGRHPRLTVDRETVHEAVLQEAGVDRRVWESHRILDEDRSPFSDDLLRERTSRSLEHVFTLLSLVYPAKPLRIAYRGLHTKDESLRGTALEYLESVLPPDIQGCLWPFLDDRRTADTSRPSADALDALLRSHETIQLRLDDIRRGEDETTSPGGA